MKFTFETSDPSTNALAVRGGQRNRLDPRRAKGNRFCDHCHWSGHTSDQCFKLIGYSDWYQGSKDSGRPKRNTNPRAAAHLVNSEITHDTPFDHSPESLTSIPNPSLSSSGSSIGQFDSNLVQAVAQEVMKLVKGQ